MICFVDTTKFSCSPFYIYFNPIPLIPMDNELAELASKVKIKVKDVEVEVRDQKAVSDSARKRERENKKLVNLVSLLTNKLLR